MSQSEGQPQKPFLETAGEQLRNNIWEVFLGVIAILIGLNFINSFGIYILLIVLFGGIFAALTHHSKYFPISMLVIGMAFGYVIGANLAKPNFSEANTTSKIIVPTPSVSSTPPAYQSIDEAQWLDEDKRVSILGGNATLVCEWIWPASRRADCVVDAIGQTPRNFSLEEAVDYLFVVNDKSYYIILLDLNEEQVYFKTVLIPPELIPTAIPTSGAY